MEKAWVSMAISYQTKLLRQLLSVEEQSFVLWGLFWKETDAAERNKSVIVEYFAQVVKIYD